MGAQGAYVFLFLLCVKITQIYHIGLLMKKIGFLCAILNSSIAVAASCPDYDDRRFDIIMINHTDEVCVLMEHTLNNGIFFSEKKIPNTLLVNEESRPIQLYISGWLFFELLSTNLELSYQCGATKFVAFESQKSYFQGDPLLGINPLITITGSASSLSNMDAKYSYIRGSCKKNQSSTIYWTLY